MGEAALLQRIDSLEAAAIDFAKLKGFRMTRQELSDYLGISKNTLSARVSDGSIPAPAVGGKWLFYRVLEWQFARRADPKDSPIDTPGFHLYRHFDKENRLLYVGVSLNALGRLAEHRENAAWFRQITRVEITNWPTREASLRAEKAAIRAEAPLHNIQHAIRRAA